MTQPTPPVSTPPGDPAPTTETTPPTTAEPVAPKPDGDKPLGPGGEKALAAEREARKALEQKFKPLEALLTALNGGEKPTGDKSEVDLLNERFATYEQQLATEREARWRVEVAQAKNLTAEQAAWLQGGTQEELLASADRLLAAFPGQPAGPRNPAPDPSQGGRGGQPGPDVEAQIAEAQKAGDFRRVIALQKSKLANVTR